MINNSLIIIVICCVVYALMNSFGASLIKSQLQTIELKSFHSYIVLLLNIKVIIGFSLIFISALVLFKALSLGSFSLIVPLSTGINFLCTTAIGYFLFNDKLNFYQYVGLVLILSGILFISSNTLNDN